MVVRVVDRTGVSVLLLIGLAEIAGVLLIPSSQPPLALAGLVALVAGALLLEVELPGGGRVSLGHAVVIAFSGLLAVHDFVVVVGLAIVVVVAPQMKRCGAKVAGLVTLEMLVAAGAGLAGRVAGSALVSTGAVDRRTTVVVPVLLAGVTYLGVIFLAQIITGAGSHRRWRSTLSIYGSLLCAAALLALASERATLLGAVALVPLLVLRLSFRRYVEVRRTYLEATQALSMIPEVAGVTVLGHGERTAVYASVLAESLGLAAEEVDLVATVARLHHVGQIAHSELPARPCAPTSSERRQLGRSGADILAGTGFLRGVGPLVAAVQSADSSQLSELEAIVRVASTLEDLIGRDPMAMPDAVVGLLARHEGGLEGSIARRLAELCQARPALAEQACAVSASLTTERVEAGLLGSDG